MGQLEILKRKHATIIEEFSRHCKNRGVALTPIRLGVLLQIVESEPISAYDVLRNLSTKSHLFKPPTIYRALSFLMENGLAHRIEKLGAYVTCKHFSDVDPAKHCCSFFLCEKCKHFIEICEFPLTDWLRKYENEKGIEVKRHVVEIYGLCRNCKGEEPVDNKE